MSDITTYLTRNNNVESAHSIKCLIVNYSGKTIIVNIRVQFTTRQFSVTVVVVVVIFDTIVRKPLCVIDICVIFFFWKITISYMSPPQNQRLYPHMALNHWH